MTYQGPTTNCSLVLTSRDQPLTVEDRPIPTAIPGSAVVHVLVAGVLSYSGQVYSGKRPYPFPTPMVPGCGCIGRIAFVGPDSTSLTPGQLVFVDCTIRSRDDPGVIFLQGLSEGFEPGSKKLMAGEWRDGSFAEYVKAPLENCFAMDEKALLGPKSEGGLGYKVESLAQITQLLVANGGLRDVNVTAGETVIVTPATGPFGSAAVRVALAMGARVLAMGRNVAVLTKLVESSPPGRVIPIPLTTDASHDAAEIAKHGPVDVFFDISPHMASGSHHIKTCIEALRWGGRVSLMGGRFEDVPFPHRIIMRKNLTLKGTWMFSREQAKSLVQMINTGVLRLDGFTEVVGKFALEEWKEALEMAEKRSAPGEAVVFVPSKRV